METITYTYQTAELSPDEMAVAEAEAIVSYELPDEAIFNAALDKAADTELTSQDRDDLAAAAGERAVPYPFPFMPETNFSDENVNDILNWRYNEVAFSLDSIRQTIDDDLEAAEWLEFKMMATAAQHSGFSMDKWEALWQLEQTVNDFVAGHGGKPLQSH